MVVVQGARPVWSHVSPRGAIVAHTSPPGPVIDGGDPGAFVNHWSWMNPDVSTVDDDVDVLVQHVPDAEVPPTLPALHVSAGAVQGVPLEHVQP